MAKQYVEAKRASQRHRHRVRKAIWERFVKSDQTEQFNPAVVLERKQVNAMWEYSKLVDRIPTRKGYMFRTIKQGSLFCSEKRGAVLCRVKCLKDDIKVVFITDHESVEDDDFVLLAVFDKTHRLCEIHAPYCKRFVDHLGYLKPNIVKPNAVSHYGSKGYNYGWGSRAAYTSIVEGGNRSSVGEYVNKQTVRNNPLIDDLNMLIEEKMCNDINAAERHLDSLFKYGSITRDGSTVVVASVQNALKEIPALKEHIRLLHGTGYTSMFMNIDYECEEFHNEEDMSYTLLSVPPQEAFKYRDKTGVYFQFRFVDEIVDVSMDVGSVVYFNGYFIEHRQCIKTKEPGKSFINVSAYGNKRLFTNLRSTCKRLLQNCDEENDNGKGSDNKCRKL
jgi:hypothetical protein